MFDRGLIAWKDFPASLVGLEGQRRLHNFVLTDGCLCEGGRRDEKIINFEGDLIGEENGPEIIESVNDTLSNNIIKCAVDISEVRYINSSGIGVLITILTKFRNKGGEVVIVNPSEHVKKLLAITKLNAIFSIVDSIAEAKEELNK